MEKIGGVPFSLNTPADDSLSSISTPLSVTTPVFATPYVEIRVIEYGSVGENTTSFHERLTMKDFLCYYCYD
jgi:hypothetical protein